MLGDSWFGKYGEPIARSPSWQDVKAEALGVSELLPRVQNRGNLRKCGQWAGAVLMRTVEGFWGLNLGELTEAWCPIVGPEHKKTFCFFLCWHWLFLAFQRPRLM